jgi:hypothetical protein
MEDYSGDIVAIFQSIMYRPGTIIDLSLYPDKILFNHATGMIADSKNSCATLESGGVYTLEVPTCNLIKESLRHVPEVLTNY